MDALCGVLRQFGQMLPVFFGRSNNLHLLPVVAKFFSAIEADDIHPGHRSGLRTVRSSTDRNRKAVIRMAATENCIDEFLNHTHLPTRARGQSFRGRLTTCRSALKHLDSPIAEMVSLFAKVPNRAHFGDSKRSESWVSSESEGSPTHSAGRASCAAGTWS